jgi:hypothetical protein
VTLGKADDPTIEAPTSFKPTNYDVVCGRNQGKLQSSSRASAVQRMDGIQASSKIDKTMVLNQSRIWVQRRMKGHKVSQTNKDGLFTVISDDLAREKKWDTPFETIMAAEKRDETARNNQVARKSIPTCWPNNSPFSKLGDLGLATTNPR